MIEVKIPAEIQDYKSKLIAGLSIRQFLAIAGAIIIGGGLGVIGKDRISEDILLWLIMLSVIPFVGFGFVKVQDMKFEEFVKQWINFNFFPQKRAYETDDCDPLTQISEEIVSDMIKNERIAKGEYFVDEEEENEDEEEEN